MKRVSPPPRAPSQKELDENPFLDTKKRKRHERFLFLLRQADTWDALPERILQTMSEFDIDLSPREWFEDCLCPVFSRLENEIRRIVEKSSKQNDYGKHCANWEVLILRLALAKLREILRTVPEVSHASQERSEISEV